MTTYNTSTAELLTSLFKTRIESVDGGFKVKEVNGHGIYVLRMIYNWRIARSDSPVTYDRAWCYYGTDHGTLIRTVHAALEWDGGDDTAPEGWDKNATTGEYAEKR